MKDKEAEYYSCIVRVIKDIIDDQDLTDEDKIKMLGVIL